jgi:hypothetical protein
MICNTCGWDTDCNAGNVGCLMGIKNGLRGLGAGPDWRGPVADRLYLPAADGGRAISDALLESLHIVNIARALQGAPALQPKGGARFHFSLPGSVQGWMAAPESVSANLLRVENAASPFKAGECCLALHYQHLAPGCRARAATATFTPPRALRMPGYDLTASPTLYPGQTVEAELMADMGNIDPVTVQLFLQAYAPDGATFTRQDGPSTVLAAGEKAELCWNVTQEHYHPIAEVGIEIIGENSASGILYVNRVAWSGVPEVVLIDEHSCNAPAARLPWVNAMDWEMSNGWDPLWMIQNRGRGMVIQGTQDWQDYLATADLLPHLCAEFGLAVRVQGLRRYYALLGCPREGKMRLVKRYDGDETILAEIPVEWVFDRVYSFSLQTAGNNIRAEVSGLGILEARDSTLLRGAVGLITAEGRLHVKRAAIHP